MSILLLEDGTNLLLEDGNELLLETVEVVLVPPIVVPSEAVQRSSRW